MMVVAALFFGCGDKQGGEVVKFAVSAEYPPFEYYENGNIVGFDIDLARLIAKELNKRAVFVDMQFNSILAAVSGGVVDAGISTITITAERQRSVDFSRPYYIESMAVVFKSDKPIYAKSQLAGKRVACQLGTTMELWLRSHIQSAEVVVVDSNNQAVEMLIAGRADAVIIDLFQGITFAGKHKSLSFVTIDKADSGYGIVFKKDSPLRHEIDRAISILEARGDIADLKNKWMKDRQLVAQANVHSMR